MILPFWNLWLLSIALSSFLGLQSWLFYLAGHGTAGIVHKAGLFSFSEILLLLVYSPMCFLISLFDDPHVDGHGFGQFLLSSLSPYPMAARSSTHSWVIFSYVCLLAASSICILVQRL